MYEEAWTDLGVMIADVAESKKGCRAFLNPQQQRMMRCLKETKSLQHRRSIGGRWCSLASLNPSQKLHVCIEHIRSCREQDAVNRNAVVQF